MRFGLRAFLGISLALNAILWLIWRQRETVPAAQEAEPATSSAANEKPPRPDLRRLENPRGGDPHLTEMLTQGGLTAEEAENIQVMLINQAYEKKRRALLEINDPWLTCDEIHAEAVKRFAGVRQAEEERRSAIEKLTGRRWADVAVQSGWAKAYIIYSFMAHNAAIGGADMAKFNAALAAGLNDSVFAKSDPFELKRKENVAAAGKIVAETEARMIALTNEEKFRKFAQEVVSMDLEDVWSWQERCGRPVTPEEESALKAAVLPEHPLSHLMGYGGGQSGKHLSESTLPKVRTIVGEETFGRILELQDPELKWKPATHVEMFDLEQSFRAEFRKLHPNEAFDAHAPDEATTKLRESYRARAAEKLGEGMPAFLGSGKGSWLNPKIAGP